MHKIDWDFVTESYNSVFDMHFTEYGMLKYLYTKTGSSKKMSKILGVTSVVIRRRMRGHGIPILPAGGIRHSILDSVRIAGRTAKEVASSVGCARITVYKYAYKHNIKLKSERNLKCMR